MSDRETEQKFTELLNVMAQLRSDAGCPWDRSQTHLSLKPCLLEETYELLDALDDGDAKKVTEELGDVLLQVIFHAQIAKEENRFTIEDVMMADATHIIVGNDNNLPYSSGRAFDKAADTEFILLRVAEFPAEDGKTQVALQQRLGGGTTANAVCAAA